MLESRLAGVEQLLARLTTLQDPNMEYTLLLGCFSFSKMAYSMRTVDVSKHEELLIKFDQAVRSGLETPKATGSDACEPLSPLERVLGVPLSQAQWGKASLPVALGGMRLRQAELHGPAAFLATVLHLRQRLGVVLLRDNVSLLGSRAPVEAPAQVSGLQ